MFAVRFKHSPHPNPPRGRGGSRGSSPVHGGGWEGGMLKNQRKDTYQSRGQSLQKQARLKTPSLRFPLRAGGTERARFPSRSGGNLQEGGNCKLCLCDWYKASKNPLWRLRSRLCRQRATACHPNESHWAEALFVGGARMPKKPTPSPLIRAESRAAAVRQACSGQSRGRARQPTRETLQACR